MTILLCANKGQFSGNSTQKDRREHRTNTAIAVFYNSTENNSVVPTTELSLPPRWLATTKPTPPLRCFTVVANHRGGSESLVVVTTLLFSVLFLEYIMQMSLISSCQSLNNCKV